MNQLLKRKVCSNRKRKYEKILLDKNFSLQYYARDIQERLVDADLSNRGVSVRVGGLRIEIRFFVALEFVIGFANSTLVLVLCALTLKRIRLGFDSLTVGAMIAQKFVAHDL